MGMTRWFPDCEVRVVRNDEQIQKMRDWFDAKLTKPKKDACIWFLTKDDEDPIVIVYIGEHVTGMQLYGIIAHEATHCALDYMRDIGEQNFSDEFMSYAVQSFTLEILSKLGCVQNGKNE